MTLELAKTYVDAYKMTNLNIEKGYTHLKQELTNQLSESQMQQLEFEDYHGTFIIHNKSDNVSVWVFPLNHKQTTIYYIDKNRSLEAYIKGEAKPHIAFNGNENGEYANLAQELINGYLFLSEF